MPDLASVRDSAQKRWVRKLARIFALGWRGSALHWHRHQMLYLLLAGLATPLVVSVHSIVSLDFSIAIVPGWHSTIFPPYFVAGAIFSGFAMVFTLAIPLRKIFNLKELITLEHLDKAARVTLVAGLVVAYGYLMEFFMAWFSAEPAEMRMMLNRATGPYAWAFWIMITCNVLIPQLLWSRRIRGNASALFVLSLVINLGMWLERYVIVITSLHRDYLPSAWGMYAGTIWDWTLFIGSIGTFIFLFLLFIRCLPVISIYEMREFIHQKKILQKESQTLRKREEAEEHVPEERLYATVAEFEDAERLWTLPGRSAAWDINEWMPIPLSR